MGDISVQFLETLEGIKRFDFDPAAFASSYHNF